MTSDRPYRKAMSQIEALAEIKAQAGKQFDPAIVAAFCAIVHAEAAHTQVVAAHEAEVRPATSKSASPLAGYDSVRLARAAFRQTEQAMAILSQDLRIVVANQSLAKAVGLPAEEMAGRACRGIPLPCQPENDVEKEACKGSLALEAMRNGTPASRLSHHSARVLSTRATPIRSGDGVVIGATVAVGDASERLSDALTGAYNYRFFQETLDREYDRGRHYMGADSL